MTATTFAPARDKWEAFLRLIDIDANANTYEWRDPASYDREFGIGAYEADRALSDRGYRHWKWADSRGMTMTLKDLASPEAIKRKLMAYGEYIDATEDNETAEEQPVDDAPVFERLGARFLADIPDEPPPPLLISRLDPTSHTILYGEGGVGKGTTAAWWIVQLVAEGHRVLVIDYEDHPEEWSRRIEGLGGIETRKQVVQVSPHGKLWRGKTGAIWDQAEDIRQLAEYVGATYLVIDSIIPACGGTDVSGGGTDAPALYGAALQTIGLPTLSIAHVTKQGDLKYPFGSVFWHNLARLTWSLSKTPNGESVVLQNRKHNNYEKQPSSTIQVFWLNGKPYEVTEKAWSAAIADLIWNALEEPMALPALVAALNEDVEEEKDRYKKDSIQAALRRGVKATGKNPQRFTVENEKWSRFTGVDSKFAFTGGSASEATNGS